MIEVLIDELSQDFQELVFFHKDVKETMEQNMPGEFRDQRWNIASLQNGYVNALFINKERGANDF
jgi:hypothetical protein